METIRGTVSRTYRSAKIWRDEDVSDVAQTISFQIDDTAVELTLLDMPPIGDGDEVVVSGDFRRGVLHGLAFKNLSNGSYGKAPNSAIRAVCWTVAYIGLLTPLAVLVFPPAFLLAPVFAVSGLRTFVRGLRTGRALRTVRGVRRRVS